VACSYYRARYYHPGLQRFISEDPIGFAGGDFNIYAYGRNNPMRFTDPLGLWYFDFGFNLPVLGPGAGVSLDFQFNNDCFNIVPGLYVGAPGFQALVVSGQPSPGLQMTLSGGYHAGGSVTFQDGKFSSYGGGYSTPGAALEFIQFGIPILQTPDCKPIPEAGPSRSSKSKSSK